MSGGLNRTIWRWHFYAALFVMPMVLLLALTGAVFLFKPQVDRWEERNWHRLPLQGETVSPDEQVAAALATAPGARFQSYRIPERADDAAMIHLAFPHGKAMRDVFVSPQGKVLGQLDPEARIELVVQHLHGQLLIGRQGSWLVELAASWAIVMLLSGLYLWWPRGRVASGVVWPRLGQGRQVLWRDLHAVTGFWVSGLALVLLITGLPWADAWGSGFKALREQAGWVKGKQDWTIGGRPADGSEHVEHDHAAMAGAMTMAGMTGHDHAMIHVPMATIVARARSEHLPYPVLVSPPRMGSMTWTVKSDTQDRPRRVTISYDAMTGRETGRENFADKHAIDRAVGYGVAWHEGALFGWFNQLIGVATALALVMVSATGFVLWRRRKPEGLGAPPPAQIVGRGIGINLLIGLLIVLLPLFALSLLLLWLLDRLVLPRLPGLSRWLGIAPV